MIFIMQTRGFKKFVSLMAVMTTVLCLGVPVLAGDGSGTMLPIVGGLLAVSVVLIIVYVVMSSKKKKR